MSVDPIRNFRFRVEIDGILDAGFTEASGFDSSTDVIEYREGKDPAHVRKLPGLNKFGDVTLKYGVTGDTRLFEWRKEIVDGRLDRRTVYIVAFDENGDERVRWQCRNAWPSRLDPSDYNARGNDVAIDTLTITCEEVTRS
ncbi:MAG: phage tail protein [Chloroflexota bacterium]